MDNKAQAEVHVTELIDALVAARKAELLKKISNWPRNHFYASDIWECEKYLVHSVLDWQKRLPYDEWLQAIFDRGNEEERIVTRDLLGMGFDVIEGQAAFEIKDKAGQKICGGRIDAKIKYKGRKFPAEIKSMNGNIFNQIKSIDDFQKMPHLRKYLRQSQLYLYGHEEEEGLFILSDLQGHYKFIPVYLSFEECDSIIKRMERAWAHIQAKTYPEPMLYDEKVCGRCPFKHICLHEVKNEAAVFLDDPELESQLARREELKPLVSEYERLDEVRQRFRDYENVFIGKNWRITTKTIKGSKLDKAAMTADDAAVFAGLTIKYTKPAPRKQVDVINLADQKIEE